MTTIQLEHGERYGKLTVLAKVKTLHGWRYRVGCGGCGYSLSLESAKRLMSGRIKACSRCRKRSAARSATQSEVKEER